MMCRWREATTGLWTPFIPRQANTRRFTPWVPDTDWVTGFTGANGWQTNLTNEIQRAFGLGVKILSVNAHMGNPVTGFSVATGRPARYPGLLGIRRTGPVLRSRNQNRWRPG